MAGSVSTLTNIAAVIRDIVFAPVFACAGAATSSVAPLSATPENLGIDIVPPRSVVVGRPSLLLAPGIIGTSGYSAACDLAARPVCWLAGRGRPRLSRSVGPA